MVKHNGTEVQAMTYNGATVNSWIHNGVEVFSAKVQLKYVVSFYLNDANGRWPGNIKIYSTKDNKLLKNVDFNVTSPYNDGRISVVWGSLLANRWTFTAIVNGTISASGVYNGGVECGGTNKQIVPYTQSQTCTVTFTTTDKYKV